MIQIFKLYLLNLKNYIILEVGRGAYCLTVLVRAVSNQNLNTSCSYICSTVSRYK